MEEKSSGKNVVVKELICIAVVLVSICSLCACKGSAIEALNEKEAIVFNYLVDAMLDDFDNPSDIRIGSLYHISEGMKEEDFQKSPLNICIVFSAGGKEKPFWIMTTKVMVIHHPMEIDRISKDIPIEESVMSVSKLNAALDEYWSNQNK